MCAEREPGAIMGLPDLANRSGAGAAGAVGGDFASGGALQSCASPRSPRRFTSFVARSISAKPIALFVLSASSLAIILPCCHFADLQTYSRCDASRRRRHEFRSDRVAYGFAQDSTDLGLGRGIEPPARNLIDRAAADLGDARPRAPWFTPWSSIQRTAKWITRLPKRC